MIRECRIIIVLSFILMGGWLQAQEICDNGFDDDGNGLTDLNDPACVCEGITIPEDATDHLPNPSFEDIYCCPSWYAQMGCAAGWIQGTNGTSDFHHECGWIGAPVQHVGLAPFPDGSGVAGTIFSSGWKEYIAACLYETLEGGVTYTLKFHIASTPITGGGAICNDGDVYYPAVDIAIFGNPTCAKMPLATYGCPAAVEPTWTVIGSATYAPAAQWTEMEITFTPPTDIRAVMIGPPCNLPPGYGSGSPCFPYFLFDGLTLDKYTPVPDISISAQGHPCLDNLVLTALGGAPGASWQWFFDGIALPGETGAQLSLPESQYQDGTYSVLLILGEQCLRADIELQFPLPEPSVEEVLFCPGTKAICAGKTFDQPGAYDVVLSSAQGCDSLVTCLLQHFPFEPADTFRVVACAAPYISMHGDTLTKSGLYKRTFTDHFGCDSTVFLDLHILQPDALIQASGALGCDTTLGVTLQADTAVLGPGTAVLQWLGPSGGIQGDPKASAVTAKLPGTYCLWLEMTLDGTTCADSACIQLERLDSLPPMPGLAAPDQVCAGSQAQIQLALPLGIDSVVWSVSAGLAVTATTDSSFLLSATSAGKHVFCAASRNACGESDTLCAEIFFLGAHPPTWVSGTTCDPATAGTDSLWLTDQHGCDSLVVRSFIFTGVYSETEQVIVCGAGVDFLDTLLVTSGPCDSLFITEYSHRLPDTVVLQAYTCDPAMAGTAVLSFTNQWGCDSLVIITTAYVGSDTQFVLLQTCDPTLVGISVDLVTGGPCDSVVVTEKVWVPALESRDTIVDCTKALSSIDTLTLQATTGCDSLVITLRQGGAYDPLVEIEPERCAGARNGSIGVLVGGGGTPPFRYRLGQGSWQVVADFTGLAPGTYSVQVEDANGCLHELQALLVGAGEVVSVDAGQDREVIPGAMVDLSAVCTPPAVSWQWTATDPLACASCPLTALGPVSVAQEVQVTAVTAEGCLGQDALRITLAARPGDTVDLYIPNGFSPNGDGINEIFSVFANTPEVTLRNLAIYDRWGNALFHAHDLPVNDPSRGWDGSFRGKVMDPGVYVYVIEAEWPDGSLRLFKGDLTLVR